MSHLLISAAVAIISSADVLPISYFRRRAASTALI